MPVKFDSISMSRVEISDCTSSPAGGRGVCSAAPVCDPAKAKKRAARPSAVLMSNPRLHRRDAVKLRRCQNEIEQEADGDGEHHERKKRAQLLAAKFLPRPRPKLTADDAAGGEDQPKNDIEGLRETGVEHAHHGGDEDDLEERCADHNIGRH